MRQPRPIISGRPPRKRSKPLPQSDDDSGPEPLLDINWPDDRGSVVEAQESLANSYRKDVGDLEARFQEVDELGDEEVKAELPLSIDLQAIQLEDQYEALRPLPQDEEETVLPTIEFDTIVEEEIADVPSISMAPPMPPPEARRPSNDASELLPQYRIHDEDPHPFLLALGLWCEEAGVSRKQYSSLREILRMLEPHPILSRLPTGYAPLRRRTKGWLPQLQLRRAHLPLIPNKLPSMPEKRKKKAPRSASGPIKEHLYFFDPVGLFSTILRSSLASRMHFGLGHFKTNPKELWESLSWLSSVRCTSGVYAHYRNGNTIFPSDWIVYDCPSSQCTFRHLGRVVEVGLDFRDEVPEDERGDLKLRVQHAFWSHEIPSAIRAGQQFAKEDVLLRTEFSFLRESAVQYHQSNIIMHYDPEALPQLQPNQDFLICRSLLNQNNWIQPLSFSAPHRGELELRTYGREYFQSNFDVKDGQNRCISLPYLLFLDGFGLYRNSYRSMMGVYLMLGSLSFSERMRRVNVFPLTLGPHGSNLDDVLDSLVSLKELDKGIVLDLPQRTRVCVFPLCMTGDMPAQNKNSGFKTQRATLGCRFCVIPKDLRDQLDYDVIQNGRFHFKVLQQRDEMKAIRATARREAYATLWGLSTEEPALVRLFPALDIIRTRPSDPAHSEYAGLCKQLHQLLLDAILSPSAVELYAGVLRRWPFAPGFARVQSPIHHLKSYSLSEHARWIVVVPALLRCWLRPQHLQPLYLNSMQEAVDARNDGFTATNSIVRAFSYMARSTSLLMTDRLTERSKLLSIVKRARGEFQMLLRVAAAAADTNPRSRSATPVRTSKSKQKKGPSKTPPQVSQVDPAASQKGQEYENDQKRPNVHIALHYEDTMVEYGMPSNVNVLIGEDKHRYFKKVVYQTNHVNVERLLLEHENLRQSVRLLLLDAWPDEEQVTAVMKDIYRKCPTLFESLVSKSEQDSLRSSLIGIDDDDEITLQSDPLHQHVTATGRLKPKYCREVLKVPTRANDPLTTIEFKTQLRRAFTQDYRQPNVIYLGPHGFQWCRKVGFTSGPSMRRYSFALGDFVLFQSSSIGRIDGLLVVRLSNDTSPQLFLKLTIANPKGTLDPILEVPLYETSGHSTMVGLPGLTPARPYLIPVISDEGGDLALRQRDHQDDDDGEGRNVQDLLMIPWDVQYL
ncbi:MAG: hypothetical protein Q9180_004325 [Flavoplaca navasiana]